MGCAVRGMLVCDNGENTYPAPPYEPPPAPVAAAKAVEETKKAPAWASYLTAAMKMSVLSLLLVVLGRSADRQLASMMTVFSLAGLAGYQARSR